MEKKYEFTGVTQPVEGRTLHRTENGEKAVTQTKYLGWHTKTCFGFKVYTF